jgi:hypothetical protein
MPARLKATWAAIDRLTDLLRNNFSNYDKNSVVKITAFMDALAQAHPLFPTYGPVVEVALGCSKQPLMDERSVAFFEALSFATACTEIDLQSAQQVNRLLLTHETAQGVKPGEIRTAQNWIGSMEGGLELARYVPPDPKSIPLLLNSLFDEIGDEMEHALLTAALFYCDLVNIHPFWEANGRTALVLVDAYILAQQGLTAIPPMSRCFYVTHERRSDALKAYFDEPFIWIQYFASAWLYGLRRLFRARHSIIRAIDALGSHVPDMESFLRMCRRDRTFCYELALWEIDVATLSGVNAA